MPANILNLPYHLSTLLMAVTLGSVSVANAHPGGTDAQGCHTVRATRERHCHNGTPVVSQEFPATQSTPSPIHTPAFPPITPHEYVRGQPIIVTNGVVATSTSESAPDRPFTGDLIEGIVVRVLDGDTIKVYATDEKTYTVRLRGISAPEKGQPYGNEARQALTRVALKKKVTVQWHKRDRFGRWVGRIFTVDGDLSYQQLQSGSAWWFAKFGDEQEPSERRWDQEAESNARVARLGLWAADAPMPPWEWRAQPAPSRNR